MRRFFAPKKSFRDGLVTLSEEESHHLRDVLRLGVGDDVHIYDGEGREFAACVTSVHKHKATLRIGDEVPPSSPESPLALTLAAALLKGDKFDLVVQKAAELGVTKLVPLYSVRCAVRKTDISNRMVRWHRIAQASTRQSGRAQNMKIADPEGLREFLEVCDPESTILFSERDGRRLPQDFAGKKMTALVGPEGGWDDAELEFAKSLGLKIVTLGGRVVRAETAAIAVTAILLHRFGDIN